VADLLPSYPLPIAIETENGLESSRDSYEEHLVEALRAGHEDAYEILIQRFQHPVYNLVSRLLDDPGESADVLQEVFLKVFRKIGSFRGQASLKTWVYRIAVNEAYNHRRSFCRHRKQEVVLENDDHTSLQEQLADHSQSPFDRVADLETQQLIEEALCEINPAFRAAVVLRDIEDLSYEEIAEVLQIQLGTVKSRILRGREALRKVLIERQARFGLGLTPPARGLA
jgi:RNA polymerase sigma-70 factor (ECF subfamily)